MINEKNKEAILKILTDVDAQRLNPMEALIKIETLFGPLSDKKANSDEIVQQEIQKTFESVKLQT